MGGTIGNAETGEYRKKITAVFADLVGSTGLAERLDPELFQQILVSFLERMTGAIEGHGGSIEHIAGDAVMGVFGVEVTHDDDALRAIRAANAMLAELDALSDELEPRLGSRIEVRIGVNTGTILVGGRVAGQALSLGDPMNVAARLQSKARPGEILIGAETYRLVRGEVRAEAAGPLELRGRERPTAAYRVIGLEGDRRSVPLAERPLIGRRPELALLTVAFERSAARRRCELVTVLGDAGAGKSRLVAELVERHGRRARLLVGRCLSYGEGITYWPLAEVVRQAAGIEVGDGSEEARRKLDIAFGSSVEGLAVATQLARLIGLDDEGEPGEHAVWAVRRMLELLGAGGPLIVVLEDLQWAEEPLLDIVEALADGVSAPVLMAGTSRFELLERRPGWEEASPTSIRLRPLDRAETRELVRAVAGGALSDDVAADLVELAAGNPLFVEQTVQMLVDEGRLVASDAGLVLAEAGVGELSVPPTIEALLAARVDHLSAGERVCAEWAAVIGNEFWASAVEELLDRQPAHALERLERKLVIEPVRRPGAERGMLRFRHGLLREAVYEAIPKARRARLHERVGEWLLAWSEGRLGEVEEIVGHHFETAVRYSSELLTGTANGDRVRSRAVEHLVGAGRRAAARQDDAAASGFFSRALALLGDRDPSRLEPLLELGTALVRGGDTVQAEAVLAGARRAAAAAGDPRLDGEVRILEVNLKRLVDPRWWAERGRSEAAELTGLFARLGDDAGTAKAWHLLGKAHSDRGEQAAAQEAFEHALEFARAAREAGIEAWIRYWLLQAAVFGPTPCKEVARRAGDDLDWARARGNMALEGSVLMRIGEMLARAGQGTEAVAALAEARRILEELGRPTHLAYMPLSTTLVEPLASDPVAAERELRDAYEFFDRIDARHIIATVGPLLAWTLVAQGRLDEAIDLTEEAERIAAPDDLDGQVRWRLARAAAHSAAAEHPEAERLAREAVRLAEPTDTVLLIGDSLSGLGHVLVAAGAPTEAAEQLVRAIAVYDAKGDVVSAAKCGATLEALDLVEVPQA
jgi:class 3 adenylate cyclase/tetratricopeptide (TPR) repeat protein